MFSGIHRTIAYVNGLFCLYLALAMIAPMMVDIIDSHQDWRGFLASLFITGTVSVALILANRGELEPFSLRLGFLLIASLWLSTSLVASLPYVFGSRALTFTDAIFETVSGLTTTGSTVLAGLDDMPRGLLLWRSVTQWLGGIGIVAMGLIILPALRIGGMQFFRMESSERSDKPVARIRIFAAWLLSIYGLLTLACMVSYAIAGMTWFEALNHAMTTVSTGGYATTDASFGKFGNGAVFAAIFFMIGGAIPFTAFLRLAMIREFRRDFDSQIPFMLAIMLSLMMPVFVAAVESGTLTPPQALLHATFNIVSIVTTTGYATTDYTLWGPSTVAIFLVATFVGGCAGSTAGGFKTYRLIILFRALRAGVRELVYPNGVFPVNFNGQRIPAEALKSVTSFFFAYIGIMFLFTVLLAFTGLDLVTAFSGTLTALSNVGPGLGNLIGPAGNFSTLSDTAKWLLIMLMFLGRLEIMTVLVLLSPMFWRGA